MENSSKFKKRPRIRPVDPRMLQAMGFKDPNELSSDSLELFVRKSELEFLNKMNESYANCVLSEPNKKSPLQIIDSGATIHVCHDQFLNIKFGNSGNIKIANGLRISLVGLETVTLQTLIKDQHTSFTLHNVAFVSQAHINLVSVRQLLEPGVCRAPVWRSWSAYV